MFFRSYRFSQPCPFCKRNRGKIIYKNVLGDRNIVVCHCGNIFVDPPFPQDFLEAARAKAKVPKSKREINDKKIFSSQLKFNDLLLVKEHLPNKARILDFGGMWGQFAFLAKKIFETEMLEPVDRFRLFVEKELKIKTYRSLTEVPTDYYHGAVLIHSLEHFSNPFRIVQEIRKKLKKEGLIFIWTPNFDSFTRKKWGLLWEWLIPDQHAVFFTPSFMKKFLQSLGFRVLRLFTQEGDYSEEWLKSLAPSKIEKIKSKNLGSELVVVVQKTT